MGFSADILWQACRRGFGWVWRLLSIFFCAWLIMALFLGRPPYWLAVGWITGVILADLLKYAFNK